MMMAHFWKCRQTTKEAGPFQLNKFNCNIICYI